MRTQADFSVGERGVPWWASSAAFAAGELSTLTLVGLPAAAFRSGWGALQVLVGSTAARLLVAAALLPLLFGAAGSIYGFLGERVGPRTRAAGASLFLVTRALTGAARLMAGGIVVSALLGCPLWAALFPLAIVSGVVLTAGGVRAVVWLSTAQTAAVVAAAAGVIAYLAFHVDGGLVGIWQLANENAFRFSSEGRHFFADSGVFWACGLSGLFGGAATFGADHEMTQRLLCARDADGARRALLVSVAWGALIVALYLFLGSALFAFYRLHPGVSLPQRLEHLYPQFAATALPGSLRWLVLVSVGLVALDLPLVGMATTIVSDFYAVARPQAPERLRLEAARLSAALLAAGIAVLAWLFARAGGSLWVALKVSEVTLGPMLGAFVVAARLENSSSDRATAWSMGAMVVVCAALLALSERGSLALASAWLVVYGTIGTVGLAWGLAPLIQ